MMGWLTTWGADGAAKLRRATLQLGLHEARRNGRGGHRENAGRKRAAKRARRTARALC
jgi:hypothetical protein